MPDSLAIVQAARLRPIAAVAEEAGLLRAEVEPHGAHVGKVSPAAAARLAGGPRGKLVLVTAITPTPRGEGKTTTAIGLVDALRRLGVRAMATLRQPSLGPVFGLKGGASGGGRSQVVSMETLNLHLTGDSHAVTAAHNLAAAILDSHLNHGNSLGLEPGSISWPRALDVNDRVLRDIVVGPGERAGGGGRRDAPHAGAAGAPGRGGHRSRRARHDRRSALTARAVSGAAGRFHRGRSRAGMAHRKGCGRRPHGAEDSTRHDP